MRLSGVFSVFSVLALIVFALSSFRPYPMTSGIHSRRRPAQAASRAIPVPMIHSHNDYEQRRPLADALEHRVESVEADIWLGSGEIMISHLGWNFTGSLRELYLDGLQERVVRLGSVYGDGRPFYLWLEIKDETPALLFALHLLLKRYPMIKRQVLPILTGCDACQGAYTAHFGRGRLAEGDRAIFDPGDPVAHPADSWKWYSLNWFNYFQWNGEGEFPLLEELRLRRLVDEIHAKNRKLRFWGAPETPGIWKASADAGVDLINTDYLGGVRSFLNEWRNKPPEEQLPIESLTMPKS